MEPHRFDDVFVFDRDIIKRKPDWLRRKYAENVNVAIAPYMYLSDNIFDSFHTNAPTTESKRIYVHEHRHIQRQLAFPAGVKIWWFIYEHFPRFRLNEELIAIQAELLFYALNHLDYPIEAKSKSLSSSLYREMIGFVDSKILLSSMWQETLSGIRERS